MSQRFDYQSASYKKSDTTHVGQAKSFKRGLDVARLGLPILGCSQGFQVKYTLPTGEDIQIPRFPAGKELSGVRSLLLVFVVGFVGFIGFVELGNGEWGKRVRSPRSEVQSGKQ